MQQVNRAGHFVTFELEGDRRAQQGYLADALESYEKALALNDNAQWIQSKISRIRNGEADCAPENEVQCLNLFVPFYTPPDEERAKELLLCLQKNYDSKLFANIILLVDDDTTVPLSGPDISVVRLNQRPTYLDWVRESRLRCPGQVSILANSDIYFDDSIARLLELFRSNQDAFVALSRFDKLDDGLMPHPNPHYSQDTWAFVPRRDVDLPVQSRLDFSIGVPRCDNKIAYVFATEGFSVHNPYPVVRSMHVHQTNLRYYDKRADRRVLGGVAMVHPSDNLFKPSKVDLEIWSVDTEHFNGARINRSLEKWAAMEAEAAIPRARWFAHDESWQYPAITEQHAFEKMRDALGDDHKVSPSVYFGFPWATLIDLLHNLGRNHPRSQELYGALCRFKEKLRPYQRVVTVCQHIRAAQYAHIFEEVGVTDLFWSHCVKGQGGVPGRPAMQIHPFPLYPVQQIEAHNSELDREQMYLFSFVGARSADHYLTQSRNHIIDILSSDPRGLVVGRQTWHYDRAVYNAQVLAREVEGNPGLVDEDRSLEFRRILRETLFSLCPSGTGPNSIRLWESILAGSIPVIMADTWSAPGDPALWKEACLFCEETPEAIAGLPDSLAEIANDAAAMTKKRRALGLLAERYGPQSFVTDILETGFFPESVEA